MVQARITTKGGVMANYSATDKVRGHNVLLNMDRDNSAVMEIKESEEDAMRGSISRPDLDFTDMFPPEIRRPVKGIPKPKKPKKVKPIKLRDYKNAGRKAVPFSSHEELFKLYVTQERSLYQISLIMGKDIRQIRRKLTEFGIPIRQNVGRKAHSYD